METGLKIKKYLKDNGIKQTYIASRLGYGIKTFNSIINGHARVTTDFLVALCKELKVDPSIFL